MQFHTIDEITESLLGIAGKTRIKESLDYLEQRGVIGRRRNPNPRFAFDKTTFYLFNSDACNNWLATLNQQKSIMTTAIDRQSDSTNRSVKSNPSMSQICIVDQSEITDRLAENNPPPVGNDHPLVENDRAIPDHTYKDPNNHSSIDLSDRLDEKKLTIEKHSLLEEVISLLNQQAHIPLPQLKTHKVLSALQQAIQEGNTLMRFEAGIQTVNQAKGRGTYGVHYVLTILSNAPKVTSLSGFSAMNYQTKLNNLCYAASNELAML